MIETDANLVMDLAQAFYMENPSPKTAEHFLNTAKRLHESGLITDRDIEFVYEILDGEGSRFLLVPVSETREHSGL